MVIEGKARLLAILGIVNLCWCVPGVAQVATPTGAPQTSQTTPGARKTTSARSGPVIVENRPTAPQVVTILHRLNGIKMFRLLLRSSEEFGAIAKLDDSFRITDEVHTNVIAGLSLDDGQTIVAWLPDAEAEMGPLSAQFTPGFPTPPSAPGAAGTSQRTSRPAPRAPLAGPMSLFEPPDLTVIARDGRRLIARYVGLDGGTGLSILKLADKKLLPAADAKEEGVGIGQRVRLFGPEPVDQPEARAGRGTIFARMGETDGRVVSISRSPSGAIARLKVRSAKLSAAHVGGIAINDAGETVGIVDAVDSNEATVMPSALVRSAVKRVLERQASVPRPWLGISGQPVEQLGLEEILGRGWPQEGARSLAEARRGIMLTSVVPGSPAAGAALRAGDVILRINQEEVKTADDLSWLLEEVGPGAELRFTIARPDRPALEAVELTLSEFPGRFYALKWPEAQSRRAGARVDQVLTPRVFSGSLLSSSLFAQGIETIALKPPVASRFGASGGLLVVYVHPATAAFKAGLRTGDVIEAIDGHEVSSPAIVSAISGKLGSSYSFTVVRNRKRVVVTVLTSPN